ncbi:MAG: hypothetical protein SGARI_003554, partial [Bacillariaceae sp.]
WIPQDPNPPVAKWRPKTAVVNEASRSDENAGDNFNRNFLSNSNTTLKSKAVLGEKKAPTSVAPVAKMQKGLSYRSLMQVDSVPEGGACNLVYEPDSSGRLVEHYSTKPLEGMAAVGRWTSGSSKKIAGFKFKRNAGRNVLIGNCSAGVQGRKNYCSGWCQFVKSAYILKGDVTVYDIPTGLKAMPVDVYLYYDDNRPGFQSVKLVPGKAATTEKLLAVACIPKNTPFYENMTVDLLKWLQDGTNHGYSSKI